jgi:hypothetical protein
MYGDTGVTRALQGLLKGVSRMILPATNAGDTRPIVFAVSHCHPTRIALYAAAFQGGWRVEFLPSLQDVLVAARTRRPKAVFYEHINEEDAWDSCCSALSAEGIPFIFKGRKTTDEIFLLLLASGGYYAAGEPLRSEEIVKAVDLGEQLAGLPHPSLAWS